MSLRSLISVTPAAAVRLVALFSAILIVAAYALEFGFNVKPCELCWLQRYAHWTLLGVALLAMIQPKIAARRALKFLLGVTIVGIAFAVYHSLVEAHVLIAGCSKPLNELANTPAEMIALLADAPMPSCDKPYQMLWFSLPQWNVLAQGLIALFILFNLRGRKASPAKNAVKVLPTKKVVSAQKSAPVKKAAPAKKSKKTAKKKGR